MKHYTGIGSRKTPDNILILMKEIAYKLAKENFTLRSGGLNGADLAFEVGCDLNKGKKEIYIPWKKFNNSESLLYNIPNQSFDIAQRIHPAWEKCNHSVKKLHARNVCQILGLTLNIPSFFVICWTKNGEFIGGTRTALILAKEENIPILNLGSDIYSLDEIFDWLYIHNILK